MKFNIGDRIYCSRFDESGTVVHFDCDGDPVIQWDDDGEECYCHESEIEHLPYHDFQDKIKDRLS